MRKLSWLAAALVGAAAIHVSSANAAVSYDPFAYTTGASLTGQNGGTGWNAGWTTTGGAASNTLAADAASLSYPAYEPALTAPTPSGTRVRTGGLTLNGSNSRLLARTIPLNVDGTVAYASALFRKNVANGGGVTNDNLLLEFIDSAGASRWSLGIEGTNDKPWTNANGSITPSAGPAVTPGDTYFLVAKIVSSASGSDQAFLKVYGTGYGTEVPAAEPTTWDSTFNQSTDAILIGMRLRIDPGNTGAAPGEIDELRVADSWSEVIGVPEPSSLAALGFAAAAGLARRQRRLA